MRNKNKKVIVGLSNGVDSSVSLLLLKKQGYEPIGVSFKYLNNSFDIARKVCKKLDVPYHIIDCRFDFKNKVIGYFLKTLKDKKTPSPCLICNKLVKFNKLIEFANKEKADYIATGHYARIKENKKTNIYQLLKGNDGIKDQSYFLCFLNQKELSKIIFPLGDYTKKEVYKIAKKEGFEFFNKIKQSQDLCFLAQDSISHYLEKKIGFESGDIVDQNHNILGKHNGLYFYTIGQRKGVGLAGGPWWVVGFNKKKNHLIITNKKDDPNLFKKEITLTDFNFISGQILKSLIKVNVKTRYNQELISAKVYPPRSKKLKLVFDKPQKAITPGQWAVFYQNDVCLGGGVIL